MKFGDIVYVKNLGYLFDHYKGIKGVVVEILEDDEVGVWFEGDYEAETWEVKDLTKEATIS